MFLRTGMAVVAAAVCVLGCHRIPENVEPTRDAATSRDDAVPDSGPDASANSDAGTTAEPRPYRTTDGLVLYYPFRQWATDTVDDESGFGSNQQLTRDGDVSQSEAGAELAPDSHLRADTIFDANEALEDAESFTLELWIDSVNGGGTTILEWGNLALRRDDGSDPDLVLNDASRGQRYDVNDAFESGMSQLVFTYDGEFLRFYVDGALSAGWRTPEFSLPIVRASVLDIGGHQLAAEIGLFAAYTRALTPGEILRHAMIGPMPDEEEERPLSPGGWGMTWKAGWGAPGIAEVHIREGQEQAYDGLTLRPGHRGLHLFEFDADGLMPTAAAVQIAPSALNSPGTFTVHRVLADWNPEGVTWTKRSDADTWAGPGLTDPADRGDALATVTVDEAQRLLVDVTDTARAWAEAPESNFGLLYVTREGLDYSNVGDSDDAPPRRGFLGLVGTEPTPSAMLSPPTQLSATEQVDPAQVAITWSHEDPGYPVEFEVYRDDALLGRTRQTRFIDPEGTAASHYHVVAADPWGRQTMAVYSGVE